MAESDVEMSSLELPTTVRGGIRFPAFFGDEQIDEALSFRPHDDDIVLSTYPKTGTNWTMHIVLNLLNPDSFDGDIVKAHKSCPLIEKDGTNNLRSGSFFLTHMPLNPETFNRNAKYIIVLRNPRDVSVSYYHFATEYTSSLTNYPKDVYWFPKYAELFVKGEVWYGDYMEHHRNKLEFLRKHGKPENILYIVYEKMKKDPRGEIIRIAKFLGGKAAENIKEEKVLAAVLERTSIEFMKKRTDETLRTKPEKDEPLEEGHTVRFVRKGVVGDYVNHFTPTISKMFDDYIASDPRNKEIMDFFEA